MIFVDSNIPMYLVGADHPNKTAAKRLLERFVADGERLVTDVEVFQEILHRYTSIRRRDAIQPAFDALLGMVDEVFSMLFDDTERAKDILFGLEALSARDAIHIAVMEREDVHRILSLDSSFDDYAGLNRLVYK